MWAWRFENLLWWRRLGAVLWHCSSKHWQLDDTVLSLHEAARLANPLNEFHGGNCKCKCTTNKCPCKKKGAPCAMVVRNVQTILNHQSASRQSLLRIVASGYQPSSGHPRQRSLWEWCLADWQPHASSTESTPETISICSRSSTDGLWPRQEMDSNDIRWSTASQCSPSEVALYDRLLSKTKVHPHIIKQIATIRKTKTNLTIKSCIRKGRLELTTVGCLQLQQPHHCATTSPHQPSSGIRRRWDSI